MVTYKLLTVTMAESSSALVHEERPVLFRFAISSPLSSKCLHHRLTQCTPRPSLLLHCLLDRPDFLYASNGPFSISVRNSDMIPVSHRPHKKRRSWRGRARSRPELGRRWSGCTAPQGTRVKQHSLSSQGNQPSEPGLAALVVRGWALFPHYCTSFLPKKHFC